MAKSYNDINDELIDNTKLLWLNLYILALEYLKEGVYHFIELPIEDKSDEKNEDNQESQVSNSEKEKNK